MLTKLQESFLINARRAAVDAGHIFPEIAACEAALESSWGASKLATEANNLFGRKASRGYTGETVSIPTREYLHGAWGTYPAVWMKYPTIEACFVDRMALLKKEAPQYPHYADALAAKTPEDFVTEVSKTWSTDPQRAASVISIYRAHNGLFLG